MIPTAGGITGVSALSITGVSALSNGGAGYGLGTTARVFFDRTYGVNVGVNKRLKYDFTDASGVLHPVPSDIGYNVLFVYRQAMNFAWELGFSNTQVLQLDQNWRNGWSWNFLY